MVVTTGAAVVADAGVVPGETSGNVHLVKASSTPGRLKADERADAAAASWTLPVPVKLNISVPVLAFVTSPEYWPVVCMTIFSMPSLPGLWTIT